MPTPEGRLRGGRWLKAQREERGILQGALARRLGISQQSLSGYETGRAWVPDDVAAKLSQIFSLPEATVRGGLGLHVLGDVDTATIPLSPTADWTQTVAIQLPAGLHATPKIRRALQKFVDAVLEELVVDVQEERVVPPGGGTSPDPPDTSPAPGVKSTGPHALAETGGAHGLG